MTCLMPNDRLDLFCQLTSRYYDGKGTAAALPTAQVLKEEKENRTPGLALFSDREGEQSPKLSGHHYITAKNHDACLQFYSLESSRKIEIILRVF